MTAAQVPAPSLAALKKLAGDAKITEFAEEVEHGHTFYEGSWKSAARANVDGLVTSNGDLVELEESVADGDAPAAVLAFARAAAGQSARVAFEKKTLVLYEIKFNKDSRRHEVLATPDGRMVEVEVKDVRGADEHESDESGEDDD